MSNHQGTFHLAKLLLLALIFLFPTSEIRAQAASASPARRVAATLQPVIPGFNPDPSICRVGKDYYLVTSSNEYFPGLPIYHSRDRNTWKMIGHVLRDPNLLDLDSVPCNNGLYAPTIRYHAGMFYVVCTLTGTLPGRPKGNFITQATDPRGPWSRPVWIDAPGIDPSLFFDADGKVYYHGNYTPDQKAWPRHRNIFVQEINPSDWKLTGQRVDIINAADYHLKGTMDGGLEGGVDYLEAPHLYKKGDYYYLLVSHGGTFQNHAVSIWRSRYIFGPFESNPANPILTHRELPDTYPVTSTGHGDLVQSPEGNWHLVFLARRPFGGNLHILGRETFLTGVDWAGEWPVLPSNGQPSLPSVGLQPKTTASVANRYRRERFRGSTLPPEWTFIRTPRDNWWSIEGRKESLTMRLRPARLSETAHPAFIGRRQDRIDAGFQVRMAFTPRQAGEEAGLVVLRDKDHYFRFTIIQEQEGNFLQLVSRNIVRGADSLIRRIPMAGGNIHLQISSSGTAYSFSHGRSLTRMSNFIKDADGSFLGVAAAGRFTGTMMGMYASSNNGDSDNHTRFDRIAY